MKERIFTEVILSYVKDLIPLRHWY